MVRGKQEWFFIQEYQEKSNLCLFMFLPGSSPKSSYLNLIMFYISLLGSVTRNCVSV